MPDEKLLSCVCDVLQDNLSPSLPGCVSIVGAGPGDVKLLTIGALMAILSADVVVLDRLVGEDVVKLIPQSTEIIYAGKTPKKHIMPQSTINAELIRLAKENRRVVRLKGGDPYVFGRGGEEALHLVEKGIQVRVIPGVTAATGCGGYAGIPLTHRHIASSVRFLTGHRKDTGELNLPWKSIVENRDETCVIYMGLNSVREIIQKLTAHKMELDMPIAAIQNGTCKNQVMVVGLLQNIIEKIDEGITESPCLLVIGKVVDLHR
eukprot:Platyproteum_vivax@DN2705_c0_g1_i1.p1